MFGNDGFGPEVIQHLEANHTLPERVLALDAGTGIRDFVFDLLLVEDPPKLMVVIDAVTVENRDVGEIFEMELAKVPKEKMSDFSLHQSPSSNLLAQLIEKGTEVKVLAMHTDTIPNEISPGLCPAARQAVPKAVEWIINEIKSRNCF